MNRLIKPLSTAASIALLCFVSSANAGMIDTEFGLEDGFVTGGTDDVTLSDGAFSVTFSGGQQQQMFDGPSYNNGPAGFLFINGGPGFTGTSGNNAAATGDTGLIDFNTGASAVSFFAANRANGPATVLTVFGIDDQTILRTINVTESVQSAASFVSIDAVDLGASIGSIGIDLPGPNANPPYVLAIDSFSATAAVPEPSSFALLGLGLIGLFARRVRKAR